MSNDPLIRDSKYESIVLQELKVADKIGYFCNVVTGTVWQLSIKDDKLIVDVPNFNFQLSPLNANKFKPVTTEINLDFEFEKCDRTNRWIMYIYAKGFKRATFESC